MVLNIFNNSDASSFRMFPILLSLYIVLFFSLISVVPVHFGVTRFTESMRMLVLCRLIMTFIICVRCKQSEKKQMLI